MNSKRQTSSSSAPGRLDPEAKAIQRQAAEWLALRQADGFADAERAKFVAWCSADPRHAAIFTEVEAAWKAFDRLKEYSPRIDVPADPDLLAPRKRAPGVLLPFPRVLAAAGVVASIAAAVVAVVWLKPWPGDQPARAKATQQVAATAPSSTMAVAPRATPFLHLSDGSEVELNTGAEVVEQFTPGERRVRLSKGEAHFTVAKNPARPFVVEANGVAVRAIGTAFDVQVAADTVGVIVTEGRVEVARSSLPDRPQVDALGPIAQAGSVFLVANQRTIVSSATPAGEVKTLVAETLASGEIERLLAWQTARLVFDSTPLGEVVARFNRHFVDQPKMPHLTLGDARTATLPVSGRIRPDNLESFVEVLESSFGVVAERRTNGEIVLRASR